MIRACYTAHCDRDGCLAWIGNESTRREAWAMARSYGWGMVRGRQQFCPECFDEAASSEVRS